MHQGRQPKRSPPERAALASKPLAILSIACRYPGASSPEQLWRNIMAGRRAFRLIPPGRLDLDSYAMSGRESLTITPALAGLIEDWTFDRVGFRISPASFASTDLAHWLALETAVRALAPLGGQLPSEPGRTAVVVANTLTGEFSRAVALGLRAPFLESVLFEAGTQAGLPTEKLQDLSRRFSDGLLSRLGEPNEETLAGGLANTIAGRIANHLDLKGGAFSVDGACASSLVAIASAAEMLGAGRIDAALVGAVDLSLDPFELVGFSRVGALAPRNMRVFDARAEGFWPGEGAAFIVLARADVAKASGLPVLGWLRGWGLSSDGAGGLIRPTVEGQVAAVLNACAIADVDPADIDLVEAHGTGTPTGDPVEVRALAEVRGSASAALPIGSVKANIGHTKAAAGLAGLIKMVEAVARGILPPHVSADIPHPVFAEVEHRIRVADQPAALAEDRSAIAGVSSFGFGGINGHVILEGPARTPGPIGRTVPQPLARQDCELFLLSAEDRNALRHKLQQLEARASSLSLAELGDMAATLAKEPLRGPWRAAIVAGHPKQLLSGLEHVVARLDVSDPKHAGQGGALVGEVHRPPRIGFLFPGQAAPVRPDGGAWARRFPRMRLPAVPAGRLPVDPEVAQPVIVVASLAALDLVERLGIRASSALGHSLGELTALSWSGAIDRHVLPSLAAARGEAFRRHAVAGGGMLRIEAGAPEVRSLILSLDAGSGLAVACENGASETVMAGPAAELEALARAAREAGIATTPLAVSHAFHHPDMAPVVQPFRNALAAMEFRKTSGRLCSSVTGRWLEEEAELSDHLAAQLVKPVRFREALARVAGAVDLLLELGPGQALARLAGESGITALSVDAFGQSLGPLLEAVGAAFVAGADIDPAPLFEGRRLEIVDPARTHRFLENPCGRRDADLPTIGRAARQGPPVARPAQEEPGQIELPAPTRTSEANEGEMLEAVLAAVGRELGVHPSAVGADDRFDTRLHLGSLAVARIVSQAARATGSPMPRAPTEFAGATSRELAEALRDLKAHGGGLVASRRIDGVRPWIRTWRMGLRPAPPFPSAPPRQWHGMVPGDPWPEAPPESLLILAGRTENEERSVAPIFALVREAARHSAVRRLAVIASGQPIASLLRSVALEKRFESVRLIQLHGEVPEARVAAALATPCHGYRELHLEEGGGACEPIFAVCSPEVGTSSRIGPSDTIWVTGGARGIAAECALALAQESGAALILTSRSSPQAPDVAAVLGRARALGLRIAHARADLLDPQSIAAALKPATAVFGEPTVLLHAAAVNQPARIEAIDEEALSATVKPKVMGLANALSVAGDGLRRVYAFGSIIGRLGLAGESHYALANALMAEAVERHAAGRPGLLALTMEWSVWGGAGMGEALGVLERLTAEGVDPLGVDEAVATFLRLVEMAASGCLVVTGRFGPPPFLDIGPGPRAAPRFLDSVPVHFPGVELISETRLWPGRDRALADHRVDGTMMHPGVLSLEAMAEVAGVLASRDTCTDITDIRFSGALAVPDGGALSIRIATLAREDGAVDAVIRSEDDGFATIRAAATFHFGKKGLRKPPPPFSCSREATDRASIDAALLYGPLFFHGPAFRRIDRIHVDGSRRITAFLGQAGAGMPAPAWFAPFDDPHLVLGDPALRDASIHLLQALVAHRRVIPVSVDRIQRWAGGAICRVEAREVHADPGHYVFDLEGFDAAGDLVERWQGAGFRSVGALDPLPVLRVAPALFGATLERLAREALGDPSLRLEVGQPGLPRLRRADGRPEDPTQSRSHGSAGLSVSSAWRVGCDIESLAALAGSPPPVLAETITGTKLDPGEAWVAGEALRKLGLRPPVMLAPVAEAGLPSCARLFETGNAAVLVASLPSPSGPTVVAIAVSSEDPIGPAAPKRFGRNLPLREPAE